MIEIPTISQNSLQHQSSENISDKRMIEYFINCGFSHSEIVEYVSTLKPNLSEIQNKFTFSKLKEQNIIPKILSIFPKSNEGSNPFFSIIIDYCFPCTLQMKVEDKSSIEIHSFAFYDFNGKINYGRLSLI